MIIKIRARFNIFICINFFIFKIINSLTANNRLHYLRTRLNNIKNIFRELDRDFDDRISYKDFEFALQYNNDE